MAIRLHRSATIETQSAGVVDPWLEEVAGLAWRDARPTVVLSPSRAEGFYLRGRRVANGQALCGVRFWTPSDLRKFLIRALPTTLRPLTRAEQRLLARTCAEELAEADSPERTVFQGVAADPGPFLRAYDLLLGAGWKPEQDGDVAGRPLAALLTRRLQTMKAATQAGIHRHLEELARKSKTPLLARLLVVGFNGAHWPLWDLLRAAVSCAAETDVALSEPRHFRSAVDERWIGTWEEFSGVEAKVVGGIEEEASLASLAEAYERGATDDLAHLDISFLANAQAGDQALGIVARALDFLSRSECTRLGIIFPEANAIAAEVGAELRRRGVPLDDGTGLIQPGPFETRPWRSWLALQEGPGAGTLIGWIRACAAVGLPLHDDLSADQAIRLIDVALSETLVDDLAFLRLHLESDPGRAGSAELAALLRGLVLLPAEGSFAEFLESTRQAMDGAGWEIYHEALPTGVPAGFECLKKISRRAFLDWLHEVTDSRRPSRGPDGNHFYGRVHLVLYAQMPGQAWSHLILTGQNEAIWPRLATGDGFLPRHELAALNQKARELNRRATAAKEYEAMRPGFGHCLLPFERQDLARRDLCAALEATRCAVCITALTTAGGRNLLPSDFFNFAFLAARGTPLGQADFLGMDRAAYHAASGQPAADDRALAPTREARRARHDSTRPFGPWEFSYLAPPPAPIQLACKRWESAWGDPAGTWLSDIVGTGAWPEGRLNWTNAIGTWVHRWLRQALHELIRESGAAGTVPARLERIIDGERAALEARARTAGTSLYSWWPHVWNQARDLALGFGESLAPDLADRLIYPEFRLPGAVVALPGCELADFELSGRIDLLLAEALPAGVEAHAEFAGRECRVIDFKTGTARPISASRFPKEGTVQVALYGLAVEALGATSTSLTLLFPGQTAKPQLAVEKVRAEIEFFRSLDRMHREGIFGQRATSGHGYGQGLPMAVRPVPERVLNAKWELVHGVRPEAEEDES